MALGTPPPVTLHPRHGTHDPVPGTPPRAPGSVRRTATIDMVRPDGVAGRLLLVGRGRDLLTRTDGTHEVAGTASFTMDVAFMEGRRVRTIASAPALPGLDGLEGALAGPGFRARLDEIAPCEGDARSLLYLLLDDVPGATLVSGYAVGAAGVTETSRRADYQMIADQCAGFATGGTIMVEVAGRGRAPVVTGPPAPPLTDGTDPLAWHDLPDLPPHGMRRHRRLDVAAGTDGLLTIDQHFRDVHVSGDGRPTVIHEYEVRARVEPHTWRVASIEAVPRVLPWVECPIAVASAGRLVGRSLASVRADVRADFRGTSNCTHLNDQFRGLADVVALAGLL